VVMCFTIMLAITAIVYHPKLYIPHCYEGAATAIKDIVQTSTISEYYPHSKRAHLPLYIVYILSYFCNKSRVFNFLIVCHSL
jgi:hypothetical protein